MSTNYFNPISYVPRRPVQTPVQMPNATSFTPPAFNPNWTSVTGWTPGNPNTVAPNQGQLANAVSAIYGNGTPGSAGYLPGMNERAANEYARVRNNARDQLRGYGGVSFRQDDPSTPNVDESLMMDYQPDQLGRNERQAVLAARARANATGMLSSGFADQQIGSALQRVGEEARQIVNQYSTQINQIADQYFRPVTGEAWRTLDQIEVLYGADTKWAAGQELLKPAPEPAPAPPPPPAPTPPPATTPQIPELPKSGESHVWTGANPPNMKTLQTKYPTMKLRVQLVSPNGAPPRYVVFASPR